MNTYLEAGKIINTHGVGGLVKIESYGDDEHDILDFEKLYVRRENEYRAMDIERSSAFKNLVLVKFKGIDSLEDAALLKGKTVYAHRDDFELEEGSYFVADLIGLPVYNFETGESIGTVKDVLFYSANNLYEIKRDNKEKTSLVPDVPEFVKSVDLERGIGIKVIDGLLED